MKRPARPQPRLVFGPGIAAGDRLLPAEVAVALSFNGTTQAVMMATPQDLVDFARGFALTEGLASPSEIEGIEVVDAGRGLDVQVWVTDAAQARLAERRRVMAGPVGCGLCGIDSIEQALRPLPPVPHGAFVQTPAQVMAAASALPHQQALHDATRAAHGAGWWNGQALTLMREDVGRHNALDKLAGAMLAQGTDPAQGAVVITSRVSIDLVQKLAALRAPMLIAASNPTADAVDLAEELGITLIAKAFADRFEVYTHTDRLITEKAHAR